MKRACLLIKPSELDILLLLPDDMLVEITKHIKFDDLWTSLTILRKTCCKLRDVYAARPTLATLRDHFLTSWGLRTGLHGALHHLFASAPGCDSVFAPANSAIAPECRRTS